MTATDLVEELVPLAGSELSIVRPRDYNALLTEEAFEREALMPYWAEVWASGVALADELSRRALRGARTLELGCGLALASIAAARAGARATATDWSREALGMAAENAARNGVEVETAVCDWAHPAAMLRRAPWELVIASDVLYEKRNVEQLLDLLPQLVDERGEVLIADPERSNAELFLREAPREWHVRSTRSNREPRVLLHRLRRRGDPPG